MRGVAANPWLQLRIEARVALIAACSVCSATGLADPVPSLSGSHPFHFPLYWEEASWLSDHWRQSDLERKLTTSWRDAHEAAADLAFKYRLGSVQEPLEMRDLEGDLNLVAQKALGRAKKRKPPKDITNVTATPESGAFTFCDAKYSEVLLVFDGPPLQTPQNENWRGAASTALIPREEDGHSDLPAHTVLLNVSPMGTFNVVLAIDLAEKLPQVLTERSLHVAAELSLKSSSFLRLTFNSLGAGASVNHLHWQGVYLRQALPLERRSEETIAFDSGLSVAEVVGWPAPTLVFVVPKANAEAPATLSSKAFPFLEALLDNNLAHNLLLVSGADALRLYVVPRRLVNFPDTTRAQVASTEIFGWWIVPDAEEYSALTEQDASTRMASVAAWGSDWKEIVRDMLSDLGWTLASGASPSEEEEL